MINLIAKGLVLFQTTISLLAMTWALHLVLSAQDFGWVEPYKEVTEYDAEGNEKSWVRHASHIDKSQAALINAKNTRDVTYVHVKPALDQIRDSEPFLAVNHLHYLAEMKRLKEAPGEIEVKRFKDGGNVLDTPGNLGKPALEDKAIPELKKSYKTYGADLKGLFDEIGKVEDDIKMISRDTKKITADLTGTDEANKYFQPGLYQLTDQEFKSQSQLKVEIDDIKPRWSQAIQDAQLYQTQRTGLEDTLQKLKKPAPPAAQAARPKVFLALPRIEALNKNDRPKAIDELETAIKKLPGIQIISAVDREKGLRPSVVVQFDPEKADLGDLAKAIGTVQTPGVDKAIPPATLVIGADVPDDLKGKELPLGKNFKGVAGAATFGNEVWVSLDAAGGARFTEIMSGLGAMKINVKDRK